VAAQILAFRPDDLPEPFLDFGVIDGVVVRPALIAGVVRRIDVDAINTLLEFGQQAFQRRQVVTVNYAIDIIGGRR